MNSNNILHSLAQKPLTSFVMVQSKHKKTKDLSKISAAINKALKNPVNSQFTAIEKKNLRMNLAKISDKIKKRNQKVKFVQELNLPVIGCIARCFYRKAAVSPITIPNDLKISQSQKKSKPITKSDKKWNDHLTSMFAKDSRLQILKENNLDNINDFVSQELDNMPKGEARIYLFLKDAFHYTGSLGDIQSCLFIIGKDPEGKKITESIEVNSDDTLKIQSKPIFANDIDSLIQACEMDQFVFRENNPVEMIHPEMLANDSRFKGTFVSIGDFNDKVESRNEGVSLYFSKWDRRYLCSYNHVVVSFKAVSGGFSVKNCKTVFATVQEMVDHIKKQYPVFDW